VFAFRHPSGDTLVRSYLAAAALALTVSLAPVQGTAGAPPPTRLDHILLWGRSIDEVTSVMAVKLGFQVRAGRDTGGVANRYIRLADTSFIELLGKTRPDPDLDPGSKADLAALKDQPGARSFGFRDARLDTIRTALQGLGYAVTPVFSGPDSAKPGWRLFAFDRQPLSSGSFFIDYNPGYAPDQRDPANAEDYRVSREHPNGARALSAIWLISDDPDGDRQQLEKMGYGGAVPVRLPEAGAVGYCVPVGPTALLTLRPDGAGAAADTMRAGGPRVLGVSVLVADLGRAQRWVERGYDRALTRYAGLSGESVLAPTRDDLGIVIEFHAASKTKLGPCAGAVGAHAA
jgi:hypothetical protein